MAGESDEYLCKVLQCYTHTLLIVQQIVPLMGFSASPTEYRNMPFAVYHSITQHTHTHCHPLSHKLANMAPCMTSDTNIQTPVFINHGSKDYHKNKTPIKILTIGYILGI